MNISNVMRMIPILLLWSKKPRAEWDYSSFHDKYSVQHGSMFAALHCYISIFFTNYIKHHSLYHLILK